MAKKAAASATLEEKIQAALVPVEEQPYAVPESWCWTYIGSGFEVSSSKRVHQKDWISEGIPFYRTRELVKLSNVGFVENELFISPELYEIFKRDFGVPQIGDLLVSGVGTIGIPYVVQNANPFYFKDGNVIWFKNKGLFLSLYIYYLYRSDFMYNQLQSMSAGTTVDTYTIINAARTLVPLPPFSEQKRIVDRIESLFAKLDAAKEKAQAVIDGYEDRKAAILHRAFTGELTQKWRQENNHTIGTWHQYKYAELGSSKLGKMLDQNKNSGRPVPYLRNINVRWFEFDLSDMLMMRASDAEIDALQVKDGDLFICEGGEPGRAAIWHGPASEMIFQKALHRFRPSEKVIPEFICYHLLYLSLDSELESYFTGTTIKHLTGKSLAEISIKLPTVPEQKEIVHILNVLLSKEAAVKSAADNTIATINSMKQSILSRAFRGELGTNDSTDESALELLTKILADG